MPLNHLEQKGIVKVGVVLLVVNAHNGQVWTIKEQKTKQSTGKTSGQIGVPAETRKQGELVCDNARRALVEEMGINQNHPAQKDFYYIDGMSYKGQYQFKMMGEKVRADVVMLVYDGNTHVDFCPQAGEFGTDEVIPFGWTKPEDLQQNKRLRFGLNYLLQTEIENDWTKDLLKSWHLYKTKKEGRVRQVLINNTTENNQGTRISPNKRT